MTKEEKIKKLITRGARLKARIDLYKSKLNAVEAKLIEVVGANTATLSGTATQIRFGSSIKPLNPAAKVNMPTSYDVSLEKANALKTGDQAVSEEVWHKIFSYSEKVSRSKDFAKGVAMLSADNQQRVNACVTMTPGKPSVSWSYKPKAK